MTVHNDTMTLQHLDRSPVRAVVADDEAYLADLLRMALEAEGWQVTIAPNGYRALEAVAQVKPDVVVLDIMMPGLDGMEVMRRMRGRGDDTPVLFLTAKDELSDKIAGIDEGGDDYVTKPFSLEEVIVRLRSLVRRRLAEPSEPELVVADLRLNDQTHEVFRGDTRVTLTSTEFDLLAFLMANHRTVLSKAQILDHVWGYDFGGKSTIVELYISYLRKKIDTLGPPLIHTVRGVGYTLREEA